MPVYQMSTKKPAKSLGRRGWRVFLFPAGLPDVYQLHFLTPKPAIFSDFPPIFAILSDTQEV